MYNLGTIQKFWQEDFFKNLEFIKKPPTDKESKEWREQGYAHTNTTGTMYGGKNKMPEWVKKIGDNFNLKNQTYTIYKMTTLEIMPTHVDHFNTYTKIFKINKNKIKRAIVFLEDWKPGHYFEIANKGLVNWQAGDYCIWDQHVPHAASNIGIEPRYTLQITGHV